MTAVASLVLAGTLYNRGWGDVAAAYLLVFAALIAYAVLVIVRGRRVSRQLPPEDRRWM